MVEVRISLIKIKMEIVAQVVAKKATSFLFLQGAFVQDGGLSVQSNLISDCLTN